MILNIIDIVYVWYQGIMVDYTGITKYVDATGRIEGEGCIEFKHTEICKYHEYMEICN